MHMKRLFFFVTVFAAVYANELATQAQSYNMDGYTLDAGGGTSTGGVYAVSGALGPSAAGAPMTNGPYAVTGGFGALFAVQTPGAPRLNIGPAGAGFAAISWTPATGEDWVLQERLSLTVGEWINSPSGATNSIVVPAALSIRFYRLFKP